MEVFSGQAQASGALRQAGRVFHLRLLRCLLASFLDKAGFKGTSIDWELDGRSTFDLLQNGGFMHCAQFFAVDLQGSPLLIQLQL